MYSGNPCIFICSHFEYKFTLKKNLLESKSYVIFEMLISMLGFREFDNGVIYSDACCVKHPSQVLGCAEC